MSEQLTDLCAGLQRMRLGDKFCDVTLICDGIRYPCHRVVLSALSPYFEAMFDASMTESLTGEVNLDFSPEICEQLLCFMYTGKTDVDETNVDELLGAANMMQINSLVAYCYKHLLMFVNKRNCLNVWQTAFIHDFKDLASKSQSLVAKHFEDVWDSEDFRNLCDVDLIVAILKSEQLNCPDKKIVCKAVFSWINADVEGRLKYLTDLVFIMKKHMKLKTTSMKETATIFEQIAITDEWNSVAQELEKKDKASGTYGIDSSLTDECFIAVTDSHNHKDERVICFSLPQKKWVELKKCPHNIGLYFATCSNDTHLFLSGGTENPKLFCIYSGEDNVWEKNTDLPSPRLHHCMLVVRDTLYVIGGRPTTQGDPFKNIDAFNLNSKVWRKYGPFGLGIEYSLPTPVFSTSALLVGSQIFIFGGIDQQRNKTKVVQSFEVNDHYSHRERLELPAYAQAQVKPFLFNGVAHLICKNGEILKFATGLKAEIVGRIPEPLFPRKGFGLGVTENNVIIFGGEVKFQKRADMFQYDLNTESSFTMHETLPFPLQDFSLCKVMIPRRHLK